MDRLRDALGEVRSPSSLPLVSMIVVNRDGAANLRRLVIGLQHYTDYPDLELIVFDNGSTDASVDFLRSRSVPFALTVIEHDTNASFSDANDDAVEQARGELLLFLNNDVEPFERGWLRELVACRERWGAGAVGSTLLHGDRIERSPAPAYVTQHRGIRFSVPDGIARAFNVGDGDDLFSAALGADTWCPAVTAACLLTDRAAFDAVGGFTTGFRYGTEDVDFGLKLLAAGRRSVCCGRSVLFHRESSTLKKVKSDIVGTNQRRNRRLLLERWGPQLEREIRRDRIAGGRFWSDGRPPHIAITVASRDIDDGYEDWRIAHEFGDALEAERWRVSFVQRKDDAWYSLPEDTDYVLVLHDDYDVSRAGGVQSVAWIRGHSHRWLEQPWFDCFDVVLAASGRLAAILAEQAGRGARRFWPATDPHRCDAGRGTGERLGDVVRIGDDGSGRAAVVLPSTEEIVSYEDLRSIYCSTAIVVDDSSAAEATDRTLPAHVLDAVACGALVLTRCAEGAAELFDDTFPTWTSSATLREQVDRYLGDPALRAQTAERYRQVVMQRHTYRHRAQELIALLGSRARSLGFAIKIDASDWEQARSAGGLRRARALRRGLEQRGHRCRIEVRGEWGSLGGTRLDVAIHLKGESEYVTNPGQLNVLWSVDGDNAPTAAKHERYDLVLVAAEHSAATGGDERVTIPVAVLAPPTGDDDRAETLLELVIDRIAEIGFPLRIISERSSDGAHIDPQHDLAGTQGTD